MLEKLAKPVVLPDVALILCAADLVIKENNAISTDKSINGHFVVKQRWLMIGFSRK